MAETIEVRGLRELMSSLRTFEKDLGKAPETINREIGVMVAKTARGNAPHRTGRLAGSIHSSGLNPVTVSTSLVYAPFVHFGSIHNPRPVPFLYNALDDRTDAIVRLYETRLAALCDQVHS